MNFGKIKAPLILALLCLVTLSPSPSTSCTSCDEHSKVVFGISLSPYVRKVLVALHEKGIKFTLKETLPTLALKSKNMEVPADFAQASPLGKIPAFKDGNVTMADSAVITAYLEKTHPNTPLFPKAPDSYARTLWLTKYGDDVLGPVIGKNVLFERFGKPVIFNQTTDEKVVQTALQETLPPMYDYLEKELGDNEWIAGKDFSAADIAIVAQLASLELANETFDAKRWPKLAAYTKRVLDRPSFKATAAHPSAVPVKTSKV